MGLSQSSDPEKEEFPGEQSHQAAFIAFVPKVTD